jgi:hypothetical protein
MEEKAITTGQPFHYLSVVITVVLDWVWGAIEVGTASTVAGLPLLPVLTLATGLTGFLTVTLLQRFASNDSWGAALGKGLFMGVIAGVPFMVTGTAVGAALLAWMGFNGTLRFSPPKKDEQPKLPPR